MVDGSIPPHLPSLLSTDLFQDQNMFPLVGADIQQPNLSSHRRTPIFRHTRPFVSLSGPTSRRRPMKPGPASFWLYLSGVPSNNDLYVPQTDGSVSSGSRSCVTETAYSPKRTRHRRRFPEEREASNCTELNRKVMHKQQAVGCVDDIEAFYLDEGTSVDPRKSQSLSWLSS